MRLKEWKPANYSSRTVIAEQLPGRIRKYQQCWEEQITTSRCILVSKTTAKIPYTHPCEFPTCCPAYIWRQLELPATVELQEERRRMWNLEKRQKELKGPGGTEAFMEKKKGGRGWLTLKFVCDFSAWGCGARAEHQKITVLSLLKGPRSRDETLGVILGVVCLWQKYIIYFYYSSPQCEVLKRRMGLWDLFIIFSDTVPHALTLSKAVLRLQTGPTWSLHSRSSNSEEKNEQIKWANLC